MARRGCAVVALAVAALLIAATTPAHAVDFAPFFKDAGRTLPRFKFKPVEIRLRAGPLTAPERPHYGISDATVVAQLDNAKSAEVDTAASTVSSVGNAAGSSEVEDKVKDCVKAAFKTAAKEYLKGALPGSTFPAFNVVFHDAVVKCLAGAFTGVPPDDFNAVADYVTTRVSPPAQDAVNAAPTAFANWLSVTGDELPASSPPSDSTSSPAVSPTTTTTDTRGPSTSSFPWWLVVLVVLALGGGIAFYRGRQR